MRLGALALLFMLAATSDPTRAAEVTCPKDLFSHPESVQSRVTFKEYEVRIYAADACGERPGSQRAGVEIRQAGKRVYARRGYSFTVGYPYTGDQSADSSRVPIGTDVTGEGEPDLLISEYSGGAHCCFTFHVFRIGVRFALIQSIPLFDADGSHFIHREGQKGLILYSVDYSDLAGFPRASLARPRGVCC